MSRAEKVEQAKKLRSRCTAFKWMTIISGAVAIILGVCAAVAPPPWDVHPNMLKLIGEFMGIMLPPFLLAVVVILVLMLLVAGFNMVSGLIILILDSVQFIGIMKALGATNRFLRRVFLTQATMLIIKGVVWGNVLGLGLAAVQYWGHLVPLEPATYYVDSVPVAFAWEWLLLLNVLTIVLSLLILLLPSLIISKISPAKVMHFE